MGGQQGVPELGNGFIHSFIHSFFHSFILSSLNASLDIPWSCIQLPYSGCVSQSLAPP